MSNVVQLVKPIEIGQSQRASVVKADLDDGYYKIANTIGLALCRTSLSNRESRLLNAVMLKTFGWNKSVDWICNEQLSELTEIDISNISKVKNSLISRNILIKSGNKIGVNTFVSSWDKKSEPTILKSVLTCEKSEPTITEVSSDPHKRQNTNTKDNTNNICDQSSSKKSISTKKRITKPEAFKQFYALYPENKKGGNDSTPWAKFKSLKLTENDAIAMLEWLKAKSKIDGNYSTLPSSPFALGITKFISEKTWLTPIKNNSGNSFSSAKSIVRPEDDYIPCVLPGMQQPDFEVTK